MSCFRSSVSPPISAFDVGGQGSTTAIGHERGQQLENKCGVVLRRTHLTESEVLMRDDVPNDAFNRFSILVESPSRGFASILRESRLRKRTTQCRGRFALCT